MGLQYDFFQEPMMLAGVIAKVKKGIRQLVQQTQKVIQDWLKPKGTSLALGAVTDVRRSKADLMLENGLRQISERSAKVEQQNRERTLDRRRLSNLPGRA
jgi:hypothetical protein